MDLGEDSGACCIFVVRHAVARLAIVQEGSGYPSGLANACRQLALAVELDSHGDHHVLAISAQLRDASLASSVAVVRCIGLLAASSLP